MCSVRSYVMTIDLSRILIRLLTWSVSTVRVIKHIILE